MYRTTRAWTVLLVIGLALAAGCARSPEARKARHLERGDQFFSQAKYQEAIIEYRNVLRLDATNAHALQQLGLAHYQLGEFGQGYRYLVKGQELDPDNLDVRLKLGTLYLLGRKPEEARQEAASVLEKDPKSLEGLALLAGAADTPEEVDAAIRRLEEARADLGDRARFHIALATLYLRKRDPARAERSFKEAVAREPESVEARMVLGQFYTLQRDATQAEREFKAAAALAPVGSAARLQLADFYLLVRKPEEAKRVLREITEQAPEYLPAWRRLAEIALAEGKHDETARALEVVLKKNPSDLDGLLLRGRLHLAKRETTEALQDFQRILKLEPKLAPVHYHLALAQLQAGNVQQARTALKEATTIDPNLAEATLLLAQLNILSGAPQPAIEELKRQIARRPRSIRAHELLGRAYLATREPAKATEAFRKIVALAPKDPRGPHLVGIGLRAQEKRAEAKKAFEASLALAPGYAEPLAQLVAMELAERQPDAALDRVKKQIDRAPRSGALHYILGNVHLLRRERELAEGAYLRALELEPHLLGPYLQLGSLYAANRKYDQALARLHEALKVNSEHLVSQMLLGVVYERMGDIPKAQEAYEKTLRLRPRFAPAANNLAWLLAEHGGDQERVLQLAQMAKEVAPEDPHISDTLGWILYKRGVYQRALALLRESASKLPESPEIQYHLGMAAYKAGDREAARKALSRAVEAPASFLGKNEARKALAELK